MKNKKAICVLGGMGPQASENLYKLLIGMSVRDFGAKNNDDFPEIILHSIPVPDFISDNIKQSEALKMLKERMKQLNNLHISCFSIACNTAHIFLDDLQRISEAPFISMIEEVVNSVDKAGVKRVGIMGTPSTLKAKLYQKALGQFNIKCIEPTESELEFLERTIRNVIDGSVGYKDRAILFSIANNLKKRGAEGIILGCTELPLVFPSKYSLPVFNSVEILAMALLRNYYK